MSGERDDGGSVDSAFIVERFGDFTTADKMRALGGKADGTDDASVFSDDDGFGFASCGNFNVPVSGQQSDRVSEFSHRPVIMESVNGSEVCALIGFAADSVKGRFLFFGKTAVEKKDGRNEWNQAFHDVIRV